jgi:hypothetical protein
MDSKTKGLIFTMVAGIFFGLPGLALVAMGLINILSAEAAASLNGDYAATIVFLIIGLLLISIPIFVGSYTLKPESKAQDEIASSDVQ